MKLVTIKINSKETVGMKIDKSVIPLERVNRNFNQQWAINIWDLLQSHQFQNLKDWIHGLKQEQINELKKYSISNSKIAYAPLYRYPSKIWGIGLNYSDHALDLSEKTPKGYPASFMKPNSTIIGYNDVIQIPEISKVTTGEAELGIIIGKTCRKVKNNWLDFVAGFTPIIDITAEDILRQNPRYLTLSKSFDTFFSFGPELITPNEIENLQELRVSTVINGKVHAQNTIRNMTFSPEFLVSFHSHVMTLQPGDIISTGTPRAVQLTHGDQIESQIEGFLTLKNQVIDLKVD